MRSNFWTIDHPAFFHVEKIIRLLKFPEPTMGLYYIKGQNNGKV
jgi:hypothetical protein